MQLKEVILLGGMKDAFIYRQLLKQIVFDIDNDALLEAFKLKCLATVLLYIVAADPSKQQIKSYCNGDDLKECLDILTKKLSTVLLNDDSANLVQIIDTLNIVLILMVNFKLSGWTDEDSKGLLDELERHQKTLTQKAETFITGSTVEGKGFQLRVKTAYAIQTAQRIKSTKKQREDKELENWARGVVGVAYLVVGFLTREPENLHFAFRELATFGEHTLNRPKENNWVDVA